MNRNEFLKAAGITAITVATGGILLPSVDAANPREGKIRLPQSFTNGTNPTLDEIPRVTLLSDVDHIAYRAEFDKAFRLSPQEYSWAEGCSLYYGYTFKQEAHITGVMMEYRGGYEIIRNEAVHVFEPGEKVQVVFPFHNDGQHGGHVFVTHMRNVPANEIVLPDPIHVPGANPGEIIRYPNGSTLRKASNDMPEVALVEEGHPTLRYVIGRLEPASIRSIQHEGRNVAYLAEYSYHLDRDLKLSYVEVTQRRRRYKAPFQGNRLIPARVHQERVTLHFYENRQLFGVIA